MMIGIIDEERKAFMTGMVSEQTADIKGEDDGEFFVEKVIKMHVNKKGREEFRMKWVGYPLSETTWESFENLSGKEACKYQVILILTNSILVSIIALTILIKDEEALVIRGEMGQFIQS